MKKAKKYLVMCVGRSHSGKTTFAKKMKKVPTPDYGIRMWALGLWR